MVLAKGFVQQAQLADAIDAVRPSLGPDVVLLSYVVGEDWSGDPAIYFRVVLSDRASKRSELRGAANRITSKIVDQLQPLDNWGLLPYFSFRSQAEQAARSDDTWA